MKHVTMKLQNPFIFEKKDDMYAKTGRKQTSASF